MNVLNFVFIGLIFLSLGVIVFIFSKNIKKIKELSLKSVSFKERGGFGEKSFLGRVIGGFGAVVKNSFVFLAEWIVKHAKKLLHLVHFWLIKLKKGRNGNEDMDELEAKKELIDEEQKSLNKVIHDDLGSSADEKIEAKFVSRSLDLEISRTREEQEEMIVRGGQFIEPAERESKIKSFFGKKKKEEVQRIKQDENPEDSDFSQNEYFETQQQSGVVLDKNSDNQEFEEKESFFKRVFSVFSRRKKEEEFEEADDLEYDKSFSEEDFSDGVVKVERPDDNGISNDVLIKEVVSPVNSRYKSDIDDDLGVDRKILEKKILQKISRDPRNIENYRQLGELYIKMKNFSDALDTYKYIMQSSPRDADAKRKIEKIKLLKRLN